MSHLKSILSSIIVLVLFLSAYPGIKDQSVRFYKDGMTAAKIFLFEGVNEMKIGRGVWDSWTVRTVLPLSTLDVFYESPIIGVGYGRLYRYLPDILQKNYSGVHSDEIDDLVKYNSPKLAVGSSPFITMLVSVGLLGIIPLMLVVSSRIIKNYQYIRSQVLKGASRNMINASLLLFITQINIIAIILNIQLVPHLAYYSIILAITEKNEAKYQ